MELIDVQKVQSLIPKIHNLIMLGRGGQKIVFRGLHEEYGSVVIKIVSTSQPNERVRREIQVATDYHIPNTAFFYEWGAIEHDGKTHLYIIEEFVQGVTLRQRLESTRRLPTETVLNLIEALLEAAVAMEKEGIVHRDIKPENIMVCPDGTFKLLDFGIARHLTQTSITPSGAPFGPHTAGYAAPEQFRNLKREIDIRTDLFAIGIVAYECLSGMNPFTEGTRNRLDVLQKTERLVPRALTIDGDSDSSLSNYISVLMSKYPSRRPPSAAAALEWFVTIRNKLRLLQNDT